MEFKEVLKNRVSVRSYNGKPVLQSQIDEILSEMRRAPTARHLELYKVRVSIGDLVFVEKVGEITGQADKIKGCGAVLVFFAEPREVDQKYGGKEKNIFCVQDATLACAYAQLAATNLGLATLWMGGYTRDEEVKKLCGINGDSRGVPGDSCGVLDEGSRGASGNLRKAPGNLIASSILIIGHSDEKPGISSRKDLKEILID